MELQEYEAFSPEDLGELCEEQPSRPTMFCSASWRMVPFLVISLDQ